MKNPDPKQLIKQKYRYVEWWRLCQSRVENDWINAYFVVVCEIGTGGKHRQACIVKNPKNENNVTVNPDKE